MASRPIPPELDRAVLKAMAKRPETRFQSAELFAEELRRIADRLADTTLPLPPRDMAPLSAPAPSAGEETRETPVSSPVTDEQPAEPDTVSGQTTARGTWIMVPPARAGAPAPASSPEAAIAESSFAPESGAMPLTALPSNLVVGSAATAPSKPAAPRGADRRVFVAIVLASAVLSSTLFVVALHLLRVL